VHKDIFKQLLDRRADANKYDFGHVLVIGGSPGMVGAPYLTAEAALRVGCGLVTLASLPIVVDKVEKRLKEIMTLCLEPDAPAALQTVKKFITDRKVSVVVIGPGLSPELADPAVDLPAQLSVPVVLDAGAITAFAGKLASLKEIGASNGRIILTPHPGEYAKLTGALLPEGQDMRTRAVTAFAEQHKVTVVLKGHNTLVCHPDGQVYVNNTGNPGMATAGSGDVLSGIIAGILAQNLDFNKSVETAIYLHGLAGDLAAAAKTQPGMIASDITDFIPQALKTAGS